jgi:hypothetical protein
MRIFVLPKGVLTDIDSVLHRFLWGGVDMKKNTSKVAWKDVCVPKKEGGLGITNILILNSASMAKHIWDIARKKDSLWVKWCHFFLLKGKCIWIQQCPNSVSWTWLKIMKLRASFHDHIIYTAGTGENIFTWFDSWHGKGPLVKVFGPRIVYDTNSRLNSKLSDFIQNENWIWPVSTSLVMIDISDSLPLIHRGTDKVMWADGDKKDFSIKSAKRILDHPREYVWWFNLVWFKDHIPKMAFILWIAIRRRLSTRKRLKRLGILQDDQCCLSYDDVEDENHQFFSCPYSCNIWREVRKKCDLDFVQGVFEDELNRFKSLQVDSFPNRFKKWLLLSLSIAFGEKGMLGFFKV